VIQGEHIKGYLEGSETPQRRAVLIIAFDRQVEDFGVPARK
jgi:hypothetical protein